MSWQPTFQQNIISLKPKAKKRKTFENKVSPIKNVVLFINIPWD